MSCEKYVAIILNLCAYKVIGIYPLMGKRLLMKTMLSSPEVTKNRLSLENSIVNILALCRLLYFFNNTNGSKVLYTPLH